MRRSRSVKRPKRVSRRARIRRSSLSSKRGKARSRSQKKHLQPKRSRRSRIKRSYRKRRKSKKQRPTKRRIFQKQIRGGSISAAAAWWMAGKKRDLRVRRSIDVFIKYAEREYGWICPNTAVNEQTKKACSHHLNNTHISYKISSCPECEYSKIEELEFKEDEDLTDSDYLIFSFYVSQQKKTKTAKQPPPQVFVPEPSPAPEPEPTPGAATTGPDAASTEPGDATPPPAIEEGTGPDAASTEPGAATPSPAIEGTSEEDLIREAMGKAEYIKATWPQYQIAETEASVASSMGAFAAPPPVENCAICGDDDSHPSNPLIELQCGHKLHIRCAQGDTISDMQHLVAKGQRPTSAGKGSSMPLQITRCPVAGCGTPELNTIVYLRLDLYTDPTLTREINSAIPHPRLWAESAPGTPIKELKYGRDTGTIENVLRQEPDHSIAHLIIHTHSSPISIKTNTNPRLSRREASIIIGTEEFDEFTQILNQKLCDNASILLFACGTAHHTVGQVAYPHSTTAGGGPPLGIIYCENSSDINFANALAKALPGRVIFGAPNLLRIGNYTQLDLRNGLEDITYVGTKLGIDTTRFVYYFSEFPSYAYIHDGGNESSQIIIKGRNPTNCWPLPPSECYRVLNHL